MSAAPRDPPHYPPHTVEALLETELVTPPTRAALRARLERVPTAPAHLPPAQFETLRAVCARLIPQPDLERPVDLSGLIDERLARGDGDGWRYDVLPPDGEACRRGLEALDGSARGLCGGGFVEIDDTARDWLLGLCQSGELAGGGWKDLPSDRWFEELLAEATELYYAHPAAQSRIGYAGMADAQGWTAIGLDEREPHEPLPASPPSRTGSRATV